MPGVPFTTATATAASAVGVAVRRKRHAKNVTPELALTEALRVLYEASQGNIRNPYQIQAARAILSTLHDVGVKPSQRDLAVVFRGARDGSERAGGAIVSPNDIPNGANDAPPAATPAQTDEKSK